MGCERGDRNQVGWVGGRGESRGLSYSGAEELETRGEPFVSPPETLTDSILGNVTLETKKGRGG